jgi:hypothetical protein
VRGRGDIVVSPAPAFRFVPRRGPTIASVPRSSARATVAGAMVVRSVVLREARFARVLRTAKPVTANTVGRSRRAGGALRAEIATEEQYAQDAPYWLLTVSAGEHTARAAIAWAEESLSAPEAMAGES